MGWPQIPKPESPDPENAVPCPCCLKPERLVLPGAVCFDCERQAAREVANDMPKIEAYLAPWLRFTDWCIQAHQEIR